MFDLFVAFFAGVVVGALIVAFVFASAVDIRF